MVSNRRKSVNYLDMVNILNEDVICLQANVVAIFEFLGEMTSKTSKHGGDDSAPMESRPNGVSKN